MKVVEVKHLFDHLKGSRFIGMGTTAMCFKTPNNEVVKKYIDTYHTNQLFSTVNMLERLRDINGIQNDTYIGPDTVLVNKNGVVLGYIYPYISAPILKRLSLSTSIFDLLTNYEKLLEDTKDISRKGFRLFDVHLKNILYDGTYYIIDLDKGKIVDTNYDLLFMYNVECLKNNVVNELFKVEPWEILQFSDYDIQSDFNHIDWSNINSIYNFFDLLVTKNNSRDLSIRSLRRKTNIHKYENSYYKG